MRPGLSSHDSIDGVMTHAEASSDGPARQSRRRCQCSNRPNRLNRQASASHALSSSRMMRTYEAMSPATSIHGVGSVVGLSPRIQMVGANTRRCVAVVEDVQSNRHGAKGEFVGKAVGSFNATRTTADLDDAITSERRSPFPEPTGIGLVDLIPEPSNDDFSCGNGSSHALIVSEMGLLWLG